MKKLLSLCLVLALALSVFCGIGYAEQDPEVVTLTMFSAPANTSGLQTDTWWTDYLEKELGIIVELLPSGDNDDMQLQALMAADSLPDIVIFEGTTQLVNAINANMLVAYDDYADKMPNAQKYAATAMQYTADSLSTDGKCYTIANNIGTLAEGSMLNWTTAIRWDLYKKVGSPEIKTVWDYLDVLKQMQDIYPENEDGQKVYAITAWSDWDSTSMQNATQVSMLMGVDSGDQMASKLPFATLDYATLDLGCTLEPDSAYIEGLRWYYTANQMGILDPDSMTQTWNTALEKAAAGRLLFGWWMWSVSGYNTIERVEADAPYGFVTVLPTETKVPLFTSSPIGKDWSWSISAKSANIDRCIEYVDFMCSPDATFVLANGPQGETWDLNEEGKPYLTDAGYTAQRDSTYVLSAGGKLNDGLSLINSYPIATGTLSELYGAPIASADWDTYVEPVSKLMKEWQTESGYNKPLDMLLEKNSYTTVPLAANFVGAMPDDIQTLATQIGDVVRTDSWLAVYAGSDAEFEQIVADMYEKAKELGLEQVLAYNQETWTAAREQAAKYE